MAKRRILVLHSGGLDSTTCLYEAVKEGHEVLSLGIDYGQRLSVELRFATEQCARLKVPREVIHVSWRKPDREIPLGRTISSIRDIKSTAFLPSRNIVFLSLAHAHAAGSKVDEVHTGINCVDFSGYPDCTVEFFEAFRAMIRVGSPDGPDIVAPLLNLGKREIAERASKVGIGPHDTWSCYKPKIERGTIRPCGECDACKLHAYAWHALA